MSGADMRRRRGEGQRGVPLDAPEGPRAGHVDGERSTAVPFAAGTFHWLPFLALLLSRCFSASFNIIHDCDETFNYWEPLHYLIYGYGFQTWEYSSDNALRSYLYLLIHGLIVQPASFLFGPSEFKYLCFYALRFALAFLSAWIDSRLVLAVSKSVAFGGPWFKPCSDTGTSEESKSAVHTQSQSQRQNQSEIYSRGLSYEAGWGVGTYSLIFLCFCSGPFLASTTFLPSTFSMYAITWATSLLLEGRTGTSVAVAAAGVLLGWPFAALAAAPLVLASFFATGFLPILAAGVASSALTFAASILADWVFYGRLQCSILNLVWYNVAGGGDSALYGVDGPLFYLKNGFLNFNLALPLALGFPLLWFLSKRQDRFLYAPLLVAAAAPFLLWLSFMSLQPHKEERFLYVVYPLVCICAAAALSLLPGVIQAMLGFPSRESSVFHYGSKAICLSLGACIVVLSLSRTTAILRNYSAPMTTYKQIPIYDLRDGQEHINVCVGSEWHRFPSSFFLPSPHHRLRFLDDGFRGLLPFPFNDTLGGTQAAPEYFNRANKAAPGQFVEDESLCDLMIEFKDSQSLDGKGHVLRGDDKEAWKVIQEDAFLDAAESSSLFRAFWIPFLSRGRVKFGSYRLLARQQNNIISHETV